MNEANPSKVLALYEKVQRAVSPQDVDALARLSAAGRGAERQRAMALIGRLAREQDLRLGQPARDLWAGGLLRALEEFPLTLTARTAFEMIRRERPGAAEETIVGIAPKGLDDPQRWELVRALVCYRSKAAVARLREIRRRGGTAGTFARQVLEGLGLVHMSEVKALARRWREKRSADALHSLYLRYVAYHVGNVSIRDLVALLGPPDERRGKSIWYMPNRDTALFRAMPRACSRACKFT